MTATKLAVVGGLAALALLCFMAAIGFTTLVAPLITVFVLLVMVAGGNLLFSRDR